MVNALIVCADNVRSAYNVGSLFRTADAVGIEQLLLCGYTPHPPHPKLNKTALGSLLSVKWRHHCSTPAAIRYMKSLGFHIAVFELTPLAQDLFHTSLDRNTVMVFGNEVSGVDPEVISQADQVIKIPQHGSKESLNIASAAAIAMYEFRRQNPL
jgi:23S rRNA (guanosine2251-2'-O)-methyltransferase